MEEHSMGIAPGQMAPEFALNDLSGNPVSLAKFRGNHPALIFFWIATDKSIDQELKTLPKLEHKCHKQKFHVLVVCASKGSTSDIQNTLKRANYDGVVVRDSDGKIARKYVPVPFSMFYVIDGKGICRTMGGLGNRSIDDMAKLISDALAHPFGKPAGAPSAPH
jgi:peroxiredoxin